MIVHSHETSFRRTSIFARAKSSTSGLADCVSSPALGYSSIKVKNASLCIIFINYINSTHNLVLIIYLCIVSSILQGALYLIRVKVVP